MNNDSQNATIQQEILTALRSGAEFKTTHKEGGTTIRWRHDRYVREDYGDWNERVEYTSDSEFLGFLWRFFEWESRRMQQIEIPEPERWRNIQQLLIGGTRTAPSSTSQVPVIASSPLWKLGALLIAAAAVGLVVWLRGGVRYYRHSSPARPDPAPQTLDSFNASPPQIPAQDFHFPRPVEPKGCFLPQQQKDLFGRYFTPATGSGWQRSQVPTLANLR